MSREIKFRAWSHNFSVMIIPSWLRFSDDGILENCTINGMRESPESFELMQATGLKDKNGKEIWESDIIKEDFSGLHYLVQFDDGCYFLL